MWLLIVAKPETALAGLPGRLADPHALDQLRRDLIAETLRQVFSILSPEEAGLSIAMVRPACRAHPGSPPISITGERGLSPLNLIRNWSSKTTT